MNDVVFWGATGQAKVLQEALIGTEYQLVALVDNRRTPSLWPNIPLLSGQLGLEEWLKKRGGIGNLYATVAVGGNRGKDRIELLDLLEIYGFKLLSIVHRTAFVASDVLMGEGCQILAQAAVCTNTRLGRGVIINTAASADHDCIIGNGVHLAPGARLAGEITVGNRTHIGIGALVLPRLHIGDDVTVGAGAVVTKDIPSGITVIGCPAHPQ
jgi:sugar O-acyltransferase (sialic acid O-acetyltransferase NeuD family)